MESLRKPFFVLALVFMALAVLVELGSPLLFRAGSSRSTVSDADLASLKLDPAQAKSALESYSAGDRKPPGLGISYLVWFDILLALTVALMGAALVLGDRTSGRVQGVASLIVSFLVLIAVITKFFEALIELTVMVVLFTSPPFGTIAYLAVFAFFDRTGAQVILWLLLLLKIGFVVCLLLAQQRFLKQFGLLLLIATSFLTTLIVLILQKIVPLFLVSITDAIAAIVAAVIAFIWAIVFLVFAIMAIIKSIRAGTSQQQGA